MRRELQDLADVLEAGGESELASRVTEALSAGAEAVAEFLASDSLWGGAGSVADEAGAGQRDQSRRQMEAALIRLGEQQIRLGVVNARTASWVETFRNWRDSGI